MPSAITGITQIAFTCLDVPRAVAFYKDVLGLAQLPIPAPPTMAFFDAGGIRIMLSTGEGFTPGGGTFVYLGTGDIKGTHKLMASKGVKFGAEPHRIATLPDGREVWLAEFKDSEGNPLALMGETA